MIISSRHPERSEGSSYGSSLVVIPDLFGDLLTHSHPEWRSHEGPRHI